METFNCGIVFGVMLVMTLIITAAAASCVRPPKVANSEYKVQHIASGKKVTYTCKKGRLFGNSVLSCFASGEWDAPPPVCKESCDIPKKIQNARLRYPHSIAVTFNAQSRVQYECATGFVKMSGEHLATCRANFTWEDATLICAPASCGSLPEVENSRNMVESDAGGTRVTYTCTTGHHFGNHVLSCNASGRWDAPPPVCRESCDTPKKIQNAQLQYPYSIMETFNAQSKVQYECVEGFEKISGEHFATCHSNFMWKDATLICARAPSKGPHPPVKKIPPLKVDALPAGAPSKGPQPAVKKVPPLKVDALPAGAPPKGPKPPVKKNPPLKGDALLLDERPGVAASCPPRFLPLGKQDYKCHELRKDMDISTSSKDICELLERSFQDNWKNMNFDDRYTHLQMQKLCSQITELGPAD